MTNPWHVVRCSYGSEISASSKCEEMGLEIYCPQYQVMWSNHGKLYKRLIPFLATYIFVRFDGEDAVMWHKICDLEGVSSILCGIDPGVVTELEIDHVRCQIGLDGKLVIATQIILARFKPGDRVIY